MNRYDFTAADEESVKEIRIGMGFVSSAGSIATITARLPRNEWAVEFNNNFDGKKTLRKVSKAILLKQIEECKKPDSIVRIVYE